MCSHSLRLVLNDKRQSDDLRDDGNLFHSKQAFETIEKRFEFVYEKGCRYKLADAQWPEVAPDHNLVHSAESNNYISGRLREQEGLRQVAEEHSTCPIA